MLPEPSPLRGFYFEGERVLLCFTEQNSVTQNRDSCCRPASCTFVGMEEGQVCVTITVPQMRSCGFFSHVSRIAQVCPTTLLVVVFPRALCILSGWVWLTFCFDNGFLLWWYNVPELLSVGCRRCLSPGLRFLPSGWLHDCSQLSEVGSKGAGRCGWALGSVLPGDTGALLQGWAAVLAEGSASPGPGGFPGGGPREFWLWGRG